MKRIAASVVLLGGLSGCISITPPAPVEKAGEVKSTPAPPAGAGLAGGSPASPGVIPFDSGRTTSASFHSSFQQDVDALPARPTPVNLSPLPSAGSGLSTGAAPGPSMAVAQAAPTSLVVMQPPPPLPNLAAPASGLAGGSGLAAAPPGLAGAPGGMVYTPAGMAAAQPGVPAALPVLKDMPVVVTPNSARAAEPIRQTSFNTAEPRTPATLSTKLEVATPGGTKPAAAAAAVPAPHPSHQADVRTAKGGPPLMRLVNTKRITLNFEVKDVGPWGLAGVELWYTQNCREWKKYDAPVRAKAYVVEVDEEGMYGFALRAKSGIGLGQDPPAPGDQPEVWVMVDLTKPDVQLTEVTPSVTTKPQQVVIRWKANDKNMSRQPITLYYSSGPEGPWKVIAANLENTGHFVWQTPADAPPKFLVRAEASDLAGNVGRAESATPVLLDTRVPSVSITNVEANPGR
jgi:hypothetical protein